MSLLKSLRHLFLPHQSNNHKARLLHPASLSVIVAVFLVGQFALNFFTLVSPSVLGFASAINPQEVVDLTNQKRAENGLNPLTINASLNEVAQRKAADMFAFNYWAHNSPSGRDPWSFFQEVGYKYTYAGENLARDFMTSGSVVDAWMNSPSHKENIVNNRYKEIGVAVIDGTLSGVETTLVVQVFGAPQTTSIAQKTLPKASLGEIAVSTFRPQTVLAQAGEEELSPPWLSPFLITKVLGIFFFGLIVGVLLLDLLLVYRRKIVRLTSRNLAHLLFIVTLFLALLVAQPGAIL